MDGYYQIDFLIPTNQDWADSFKIGTGDAENFVARNLTGCRFEMHLRRQIDDVAAVMILDTENARIGVSGNPTNGTVAIFVPQQQVQRVRNGTYVHDIVMFDAEGNPRRIAVGKAVFERGVTRV